MPELVYGLVLSVAALAYLAMLSLPLFAVTALWFAVTLLVGWQFVRKVNHHIVHVREYDDRLYSDYQGIIDGRKELALNRHRARRLYDEEFDGDARAYRDHVTRADIFNGLAGNFANVMVLGLIGLTFFLALGLEWASLSVAATYALTILFMRTPMIAAVAAVPGLVAANVSLNKLTSLELAPHTPEFTEVPQVYRQAQSIALQQTCYGYQAEEGEGFMVGPLNLTLRRGELVFLVGGNGSGKSTMARLLTGLYRPQSGHILVDDKPVAAAERQAYRHLFSTVFTDFHLFQRLLGGDGAEVDCTQVDDWLQRLSMSHKVDHSDGRLSDTRFSQGQRKRLALLMAVVEQRDFLVLDEWAADQDPQFRRFFYHQLLPELRAQGKAILAITHDDHYFDRADRILKMDGGQLIELFGQERDRVTADAVEAIGAA